MTAPDKSYFSNTGISAAVATPADVLTQKAGVITEITFEEGDARGRPAAVTLQIQYPGAIEKRTIEGSAIERFFKMVIPNQPYWQDAQHLSALVGKEV